MNLSKRFIIKLSVVIPISIAILFGVKIEGYDFSFLPHIYASINAITFFLLMGALISIKKGKKLLHKRFIIICMMLSVIFLILYVLYHITTGHTVFGGEGVVKYAYYIFLISHILLSIVVIPFVLFAFMYGMNEDYEKHKRIVKFSFPLWLYVTFSGVIVYLMISPYYK